MRFQQLPILLIAIGLSSCGPSLDPNEAANMGKVIKQGQDAIRAMGKMEQKNYPGMGQAWSLDLPKSTFTDQTVNDLKCLDHISELKIAGAKITDAQMDAILNSSAAVYFNVVDLSGTGLSDEGVKSLNNCKYLQKLIIKDTKISDAFIKDFKAKRKTSDQIPAPCKNPTVTK